MKGITRKETVNLLTELISIKSMNPMGTALSGADYGEQRMAEYVGRYLKKLGLRTFSQTVEKNRPNVVGLLKASGRGKTFLFETHLDTVSAEKDGFCAKVRENRVYGRGACDAKGPLASMLLALKMIVEQGAALKNSVYMAAVMDEEYHGNGVRYFLDNLGDHIDGAVVGEPTGLNLVSAHMGCLRWEIATRGKACHSSKADGGINAIYLMNDVIRAIREKMEPLYAGRIHRLLKSPTINVTVIRGGRQVNMIPDACSVEVDRRLLPGESPRKVLAEVRKAINAVMGKESHRVRFKDPSVCVEAMETPVNALIVQNMRKALEKEKGNAGICGAVYTSDASYIAKNKIPVVVFGPGSIDQAHSAGEYVEVNQVMEAARVLARLVTG